MKFYSYHRWDFHGEIEESILLYNNFRFFVSYYKTEWSIVDVLAGFLGSRLFEVIS